MNRNKVLNKKLMLLLLMCIAISLIIQSTRELLKDEPVVLNYIPNTEWQEVGKDSAVQSDSGINYEQTSNEFKFDGKEFTISGEFKEKELWYDTEATSDTLYLSVYSKKGNNTTLVLQTTISTVEKPDSTNELNSKKYFKYTYSYNKLGDAIEIALK